IRAKAESTRSRATATLLSLRPDCSNTPRRQECRRCTHECVLHEPPLTMPGTSYDQVQYRTIPMAQTHPDRLASVASLFGMSPAPLTACRVLEVGCGNGGNLIPMRHYFPGAHFTGLDLAGTPVAPGRRIFPGGWVGNIAPIPTGPFGPRPGFGPLGLLLAHGL